MAKKKTPPSRIPVNKGEAEKRYRDGLREGVKICLDITLHALMCDMECDEAFLDRFNHYFNVGLDGFGKRYITKDDIRRSLIDERGLEVVEV